MDPLARCEYVDFYYLVVVVVDLQKTVSSNSLLSTPGMGARQMATPAAYGAV
jgi:hypothetical protein